MATQVYTKVLGVIPGDIITVDETKTWLKIDSTNTAYDDEVSDLITWVHAEAEAYCWRGIGVTTWRLDMDAWETTIEVRRNPISSVTNIKYYDANDDIQTLAATSYRVYKTIPSMIMIDDTPGLYERPDAVQITFDAGESTLDPVLKTDMLKLIATAFEVRQDRRFDKNEFQSEVRQSLFKHRYNYF